MYNGILLIDKPKGFTSHDVIAKLRGILREKQIGHSGTLDPIATGVLPVFIGKSTKAVDYALAQNKEYIVSFKLGIETDTLDITGEITEKSDKKVTEVEIKKAINSFIGKSKQLPPMYSAIQINGERLYKLARKGISVKRNARDIEIFDIEILEISEMIKVKLLVSKGTYIRSFCSDVGRKLGTFAVMMELIRTKSGQYDILDAISIDKAREMHEKNALKLIPVESIFDNFNRADIDDYGYARCQNGAFITLDHILYKSTDELKLNEIIKIYYENKFIMLADIKELNSGDFALFTYKRFF